MATKKLQVAGLKGQDGVGISSIKQTTTSSASGGENIITATLTDGTKSEFKVMNGKDGKDGAVGQDGAPGPAGSDANVTDENIKSALGYTPANEETVRQLKKQNADKGTSLWAILKKTAFAEALTEKELTDFKTAWGIETGGEEEPDTPVEPDIPEDVTLTSISVTYTGGDVFAGALLTDLSGITVTAHYSDGSTANVTGYTLSGEILEGSNTITVSYNGKTTTFTVTGLPVEEDVTTENDPPFDAMTWTEGLRISNTGNEWTGHANYSTSNYIDVSNIDSFVISRSDDVVGNIQYMNCFYDSEKGYVEGGTTGYINADGKTFPANVSVDVPDGAMYCRLCGTKLSGLTFSELIRVTVS